MDGYPVPIGPNEIRARIFDSHWPHAPLTDWLPMPEQHPGWWAASPLPALRGTYPVEVAVNGRVYRQDMTFDGTGQPIAFIISTPTARVYP